MQGLIISTVLNPLCSLQKFISLRLFLALFLFTAPFHADDSSKPTSVPLVVISQIVQHLSLDQERAGLIAALKEAGYEDGKTLKIVYANAQGNLSTATLIASNFAGLDQKPTVAVGISTPSAQTLLKSMAAQQVPVVFTAVTDPLEAKLVTSLLPRSEDITGISDALLAGPQLDLIQKLIPSVKNIGIIYNAGETNSVKAVEHLQAEATKRGLNLLLATAGKANDVISATRRLIGAVDVIYIPNDNTAVASMESIANLCKKFKMPLFAGDGGSVKQGALAAHAYDRDALGRRAGALIIKILKGQKAGDLAVESDHPLVLMINLQSAEEMGVPIPEVIKSQAKIMGEKR